MSTRSNIGIVNPDGTVESIAVHFDGYLEGVGQTLATHYQDEAKVRALLALGDLSYLGAEIGEAHDFKTCPDGVCNAYGRDRGEKNVAAKRFANVDDALLDMVGEYFYVWRDGAWTALNMRGEALAMPASQQV